MAISPPSDIVLDVARAVEPTAIETARAELAKRSTGATTAIGQQAFSLIEDQPAPATAEIKSARTPDSFKKFEAMVLQTFVQDMLPSNTEGVYGKGMAGDMWKGLMAEKIANVMSERGGIGIADRVLGDHYVEGKKTVPVGAVSNASGSAEIDQQAMLSTALVQKLQLNLARSLDEDRATGDAQTRI